MINVVTFSLSPFGWISLKVSPTLSKATGTLASKAITFINYFLKNVCASDETFPTAEALFELKISGKETWTVRTSAQVLETVLVACASLSVLT